MPSRARLQCEHGRWIDAPACSSTLCARAGGAQRGELTRPWCARRFVFVFSTEWSHRMDGAATSAATDDCVSHVETCPRDSGSDLMAHTDRRGTRGGRHSGLPHGGSGVFGATTRPLREPHLALDTAGARQKKVCRPRRRRPQTRGRCRTAPQRRWRARRWRISSPHSTRVCACREPCIRAVLG